MEEVANLTIDQLPERREKTEAVSQYLLKRLRTYVDILRPMLAPAKLLGRYVGTKEDIVGAEKSAAELRQVYDQVCGRPFSLNRGLEDDALAGLENRIELYPWEYGCEVTSGKEKKTVTVTSPVRWILTYASGCSLSQLRVLLAKTDRPQSTARQFVVSALVMNLLFAKYPGIAELLNDLRYTVRVEKSPDLGELPVVTVNACVPSFRPADDLVLAATRLSGVPAFVELIDIEALHRLEDPMKRRIEELLSA
jgi:hypothetical protein